jgi:hypothetical protein
MTSKLSTKNETSSNVLDMKKILLILTLALAACSQEEPTQDTLEKALDQAAAADNAAFIANDNAHKFCTNQNEILKSDKDLEVASTASKNAYWTLMKWKQDHNLPTELHHYSKEPISIPTPTTATSPAETTWTKEEQNAYFGKPTPTPTPTPLTEKQIDMARRFGHGYKFSGRSIDELRAECSTLNALDLGQQKLFFDLAAVEYNK